MGKKKKKWRPGGRCDSQGSAVRKSMCTSFMVDRCQPWLQPRHTNIWSPGNAGNHFPDANERKTTITLLAHRTSPSPANHCDCHWQTPSARRRGPSLIFFFAPFFSELNNDASVQAYAWTLTPWQPAAPRFSYAAAFLIGHIPLTSLTQGSRIDIEEAGKAQGLSHAAGLLQ